MRFKKWRSISVAKKIWISISVLVLGYALTVVYGFFVSMETEKRIENMSMYLLPATNQSKSALMVFNQQIRFYNDAVISGNPVFLDSAGKKAKKLQSILQDTVGLKGLGTQKGVKIEALKDQLNEYSDIAQTVYIKILSAENTKPDEVEPDDRLKSEANRIINQTNHLRKELDLLTGTLGKELKYELSLISRLTKRRSLITVFFFFLVIFGVSFAGAAIIRRSVILPLEDTVMMIEDIAEGDLTRDYKAHMDDEIGQIVTALNKMVEKFREVLNMTSHMIMKASSSASEMSVAVDEQAAIATQQSASISQITTTMEELSASSTQIAGHADSVAQIAQNALQSTKGGAESVDVVMSMMEEINRDNMEKIEQIIELGDKSEEINKVMEIISNIADQTKLIAFNAALEASSAGEAGKRFGVVAVEIRRLADSVMESTEETESKIKEIQKAFSSMVISSEKGSKVIKESLDYSTQTSAKIAEIVDGAQSTADAAKQISLSTQQAKTSSEQVVTALKEIVQGSRQTTEAMRQISTISKDLTGISGTIKDLMNKFKIDREDEEPEVNKA